MKDSITEEIKKCWDSKFMYLYLKEDKNIIWEGFEWIIVPGKSDSIIVRKKAP